MMHFPPFQISSLFSKNFQTLWRIFQILPFPEKFFHFHPPKFLMTFSNFPPILPVSVHFSPVSRKLLFPPFFEQFPPVFQKIHLLFTYFMCISFPPTLTMMQLCITQCTYWTPLHVRNAAMHSYGFFIVAIHHSQTNINERNHIGCGKPENREERMIC